MLRPYSGSRPSNDDQGMLNLSGETGDASAGNTAAENSDVKFPTTVALDDIQDRTAAILDARAERRKAQRFQKRAGDAAMARANLSGATSPGGAALPGGAAASGNATGHHPKPDWRDAYLPGRDVDAVMAQCSHVVDRVYHAKANQQAMMETFRAFTYMDAVSYTHLTLPTICSV